MDEDKRLVEASCWEGPAVGNLGFALVCEVLLTKSLIQLYVDAVGVCSCPVVWPEAKLW